MPPEIVERAKPLLGTVVTIRAAHADPRLAAHAVDTAFVEVGRLHALMSFHDPTSELSRVNRAAAREAVSVGPDLLAVLLEALRMARLSDGVFDPTVGGPLVRAGALPPPQDAPPPHPEADWRDVELAAGASAVRFRRPLWLDLGGIAKGYVVDRACACLLARGIEQGCVNAGGDLRVFGPRPEVVRLRPGPAATGGEADIQLSNGAMAGSGRLHALPDEAAEWSQHLCGVRGGTIPTDRFVSVVAKCCMIADALTKVVLASSSRTAERVLTAENATAYLCAKGEGWSQLGMVA